MRISYLTIFVGLASTIHGHDSGTPCRDSSEVHVSAHPQNCNQFYKCVNGTLSLETCANGLLFDGQGAVHNYCNYHWAVNCGQRTYELVAEDSGVCKYSFGIFKASPGCSTSFLRCTEGVAEEVFCENGLVFDDKVHSCNWADRLVDAGCNPEELVGFRCPELESIPVNSVARHFLPFPRYSIPGDCKHYVTCVSNYPRLMTCEEELVFNEVTLTCDDPENVSQCSNYRKEEAKPKKNRN